VALDLRQARRGSAVYERPIAVNNSPGLYEPVEEIHNYAVSFASTSDAPRWIMDQETTSTTRNLINPSVTGIMPGDPPMPADRDMEDGGVWEADYVTDSADGGRVWVNEHGLDPSGYDPRSPGYRVGSCNCDDCRQVRLDEAEALDIEDDYEYEYEEE